MIMIVDITMTFSIIFQFCGHQKSTYGFHGGWDQSVKSTVTQTDPKVK